MEIPDGRQAKQAGLDIGVTSKAPSNTNRGTAKLSTPPKVGTRSRATGSTYPGTSPSPSAGASGAPLPPAWNRILYQRNAGNPTSDQRALISMVHGLGEYGQIPDAMRRQYLQNYGKTTQMLPAQALEYYKRRYARTNSAPPAAPGVAGVDQGRAANTQTPSTTPSIPGMTGSGRGRATDPRTYGGLRAMRAVETRMNDISKTRPLGDRARIEAEEYVRRVAQQPSPEDAQMILMRRGLQGYRSIPKALRDQYVANYQNRTTTMTPQEALEYYRTHYAQQKQGAAGDGSVATDGEDKNSRLLFKLGFLLRCADEGLTPEQTEERIRAAGSLKYASWLSIPAAIIMGLLGVSAATGAGIGASVHAARDPEIDLSEVQRRELIKAYQEQAEQLKRKSRYALRKPTVPKAPTLSLR